MMMVRFGSVNAVMFFRKGVGIIEYARRFLQGAYKQTGRL